MKEFLVTLKLVAALLPVLFDIIRAVEAALPTTGAGAAKLAMVRELLEKYWTTASDIGVKFIDAWPRLEAAIAAVVSLLKSVGEFKSPAKG